MNPKHQQFINEYLSCWNATEAYSRVYTSITRETAAANGYRLLRNAEIAEEIERRISENAMSADEVLSRLAEHARGDMADFWDVPDSGDPSLNLVKAKDKLRIIKKLKVKTTTYTIAGIDHKSTEAEFELYDAQAALEKLGRHRKLFTDKTEQSGETTLRVVYGDDGTDSKSA